MAAFIDRLIVLLPAFIGRLIVLLPTCIDRLIVLLPAFIDITMYSEDNKYLKCAL